MPLFEKIITDKKDMVVRSKYFREQQGRGLSTKCWTVWLDKKFG